MVSQAIATHDRHQKFGWTFDEPTGDVMRHYDHNHDGFLSLQAAYGWMSLDERFRTSRSEFQASPTSRKYVTTDVYSVSPLLAKADALGNNDGIVSREELTNVLATYDANGDGRLEAAERGVYRRECGESRIQHYTTHIDPPKAPQNPPIS